MAPGFRETEVFEGRHCRAVRGGNENGPWTHPVSDRFQGPRPREGAGRTPAGRRRLRALGIESKFSPALNPQLELRGVSHPQSVKRGCGNILIFQYCL